MVDLGWLGLAVSEDYGGQGYSLVELAVVLAETGRVVLPGPFLPTAWASAVLQRCGTADQKKTYLPQLVTGELRGGVALDSSALLGGSADIVLLADGNDLILLRPNNDCRLESVANHDLTRDLARISGVSASGHDRLPNAASAALALGRALAAAEACGLATGALERATAYAKDREQFGRVIGSFQAVKHHLANMLVERELAAAAAWDAARAASVLPDGHGAGDQLTLTSAVAATAALPGAVSVAKRTIQVHGGIGFTWDHESHLFLRRATVLRALLGNAPDPAVEVTRLTRTGMRRTAAVDLPPEADGYRHDASAFKDRLVALPEPERRAELFASGYLVPHWPRPWGRAADPVEQLMVDEVLSDIERPNLGIGGWVTLTIAQHGTLDQIERWVGPSLRGELAFCQMFSEPNAGSDAAAIRTRATRVEAGWLVNGQKVWTSGAHLSDRGFATVRTDPTAPKHQGYR